VDLNVDIGEGFPFDEQLLEFATSANVCCGEHAGSWELTLQTIEMCKRKGVRIGMHPGFPDRENMGRLAPKSMTGEEFVVWLTDLQRQQRGFLEHCLPAYVKPHGAWYNLVCGVPDVHDDVQTLLYSYCLGAMFAVGHPQPHTYMVLASSSLNRDWPDMPARPRRGEGRVPKPTFIPEGFADRAYSPDGTLRPRSEPGAVLEDPEEIKAQVLRLAPEVDSICLHGDTPGCLEFAEMVRKTLEDAGYEVAA
jgi:5-oxoprolinase (ATP-hydrolysing) subunit A